MASKSSIEWTEITWNPVTGCSKISQGCKHCYAERMAKRLQAMGVEQYKNGFEVTLAVNALEQPLRWRRPSLVFVNSMSDLFHEAIPFSYIKNVFEIMLKTPQHTYQILTKRSERLLELKHRLRWTDNIWIGVSVEDENNLYRISYLRRSSAKTKFLSLEPLIGPLPFIDLSGIDWVIVGGESGPGARRIEKQWIHNIRQSCERFNVPFFFKQWGHAKFNSDPSDPTIVKSHPFHAKGGCQLDGRVYREMPFRRVARSAKKSLQPTHPAPRNVMPVAGS